MDSFEKWYGDIDVFAHHEGANDAWEQQKENILDAIKTIENFPCCMSCYVTIEEMEAARNMKETILEILEQKLLRSLCQTG